MQARGVASGRYCVRRLIRENGLVARGPRRKSPTATPTTPLTPVADDVLSQAFELNAPDRVWTADITYVQTGEGWLYLTVVVYLFSRRLAGWAVRPSLRREIATAALVAAFRDRRSGPGLVYHSDQGTQYTSSDSRAPLLRHELVCSLSRQGKCHDCDLRDARYRAPSGVAA